MPSRGASASVFTTHSDRARIAQSLVQNCSSGRDANAAAQQRRRPMEQRPGSVPAFNCCTELMRFANSSHRIEWQAKQARGIGRAVPRIAVDFPGDL
jgi:hypothetical protein